MLFDGVSLSFLSLSVFSLFSRCFQILNRYLDVKKKKSRNITFILHLYIYITFIHLLICIYIEWVVFLGFFFVSLVAKKIWVVFFFLAVFPSFYPFLSCFPHWVISSEVHISCSGNCVPFLYLCMWCSDVCVLQTFVFDSSLIFFICLFRFGFFSLWSFCRKLESCFEFEGGLLQSLMLFVVMCVCVCVCVLFGSFISVVVITVPHDDYSAI